MALPKFKPQDQTRYHNGKQNYVEPAWQKNLFCQRISREGHIWNWTKDGIITRDDKVMFAGRYTYDPIQFIEIIASCNEHAGNVVTLTAYLRAKEARRDLAPGKKAGTGRARVKNLIKGVKFCVDDVRLITDGLSQHYDKTVRIMSVDSTGFIPRYTVRETQSPFGIFDVDEHSFDQR